MAAVSREVAEDLVRWYATYGCTCKYSRRLAAVLGSLGGGVDAASVRCRAHTPALSTSHGVNPRIIEVIETVLLERSLTGPDLAAAAFDLTDKISYCPCNTSRSNCDVTSLSVWETENGEALRATCPSCTLEIACSEADLRDGKKEASESRPAGPMPLTTLLRKKAEEEADPIRAETKKLHAALMLGGASGGRGSCDRTAPKSSFGGSWTSLLFECDHGRENGRRLSLKSEVLVSNSIKQSVRLQPNCVCSDLLYAICSMAGGHEFAYRVTDLKVLGGEFLYFSYVLFEEGGIFDTKAHLGDLVAAEPTSEFTCPAPLQGPDSYDARQPPRKKNRPEAEPTDRMTSNNKVDMQTLLMTVLASHGVPATAPLPRKRAKRRMKAPVRDSHQGARGTVGAVNDTVTLMAGQGRGDGGDATGEAPPEECEKDVVLPCPQIREYSFSEYLRERPPGSDIVHALRLGGTYFKIPARLFKKNFLLPLQNVLFSPPVVVRINFNRYRVLSGLWTFFDRVEVVGPGTFAGVRLDTNAAHGAVLRVLARLRENSVKRSIESGGTGRFGLLLKNPSTNLGLSIPSNETKSRRLGVASTLGMLAGMAT